MAQIDMVQMKVRMAMARVVTTLHDLDFEPEDTFAAWGMTCNREFVRLFDADAIPLDADVEKNHATMGSAFFAEALKTQEGGTCAEWVETYKSARSVKDLNDKHDLANNCWEMLVNFLMTQHVAERLELDIPHMKLADGVRAYDFASGIQDMTDAIMDDSTPLMTIHTTFLPMRERLVVPEKTTTALATLDVILDRLVSDYKAREEGLLKAIFGEV